MVIILEMKKSRHEEGPEDTTSQKIVNIHASAIWGSIHAWKLLSPTSPQGAGF